ncbi:MAG: hypothetical protein MRZ91_04715 [Christensenellaceae bacterium]|nr:hypothetical protein [Christensenellaceae bacterium]
MKKLNPIICVILLISSLQFTGCGSDGCGKNETNPLGKTSVLIEAKIDDGVVFCTTTITLFNSSDNVISSVPFVIYSPEENADGKKSDKKDDESAKLEKKSDDFRQNAEVLKVSSGGKDLKFSVSETKTIPSPGTCGFTNAVKTEAFLSDEVYPEESAELTIQTALVLGRNSLLHNRPNDDEIFLARFYPILPALGKNGFYDFPECDFYDGFFSEVAFITLKMEVAGEYSVLCGGECMRTETGKNSTSYTYKADNFAEAAVLLYKGAEVFIEEKNGIRYTCFYDKTDDFSSVLNEAENAAEYLSQKTDFIPFKNIGIALTDKCDKVGSFPGLILAPHDVGKAKDFQNDIFVAVAEQWFKHAARIPVREYPYFVGGMAKAYLYSYLSTVNGTESETVKSADYAEFCAIYGTNALRDREKYLKSLNEYASAKELDAAECGMSLSLNLAAACVTESRTDAAIKRYFSCRAFVVSSPDELKSFVIEVFPEAENLLE